MENLLSVIGYIGTGLVIGAYVPQIWHLWTEHCSAGISERAYALWVLSSALFLGHSITIGDTVFMVTQLVNMVALAIILVLARRFRNQICAEHARQLHVRESSRIGFSAPKFTLCASCQLQRHSCSARLYTPRLGLEGRSVPAVLEDFIDRPRRARIVKLTLRLALT